MLKYLFLRNLSSSHIYILRTNYANFFLTNYNEKVNLPVNMAKLLIIVSTTLSDIFTISSILGIFLLVYYYINNKFKIRG